MVPNAQMNQNSSSQDLKLKEQWTQISTDPKYPELFEYFSKLTKNHKKSEAIVAELTRSESIRHDQENQITLLTARLESKDYALLKLTQQCQAVDEIKQLLAKATQIMSHLPTADRSSATAPTPTRSNKEAVVETHYPFSLSTTDRSSTTPRSEEQDAFWLKGETGKPDPYKPVADSKQNPPLQKGFGNYQSNLPPK